MRCPVCNGRLLYDRIDDEWRCFSCGRPVRRTGPRPPADTTRGRKEHPRRYRLGPGPRPGA